MKKTLFFTFLTIFLVTFKPYSSDAISITMKRIVLEGPKRAEVLTVINNAKETKTFRIGWRHFVMDPQKNLVAVPIDAELPPEVKPVTEMIRFAPRRFTLAPRTSQQVRIMLRMPPNTPDGEYRSHLWLRPEPNTELFKKKSQKAQEKGVVIEMLAGVTLPVIVRKGNIDADVSFESLNISETNGFINADFALNRQGERSVYGNINYVCNKNQGDREYTLKTNRGTAIYSEISTRYYSKKIPKDPQKPACDTMTIEFYETEDSTRPEKAVFVEASAPVR